MEYWKIKTSPISGHKYEEVVFKADIYLKLYRGKSSGRKPYLKSPLFKRQKIFFDFFWDHLFSKPLTQRKQRLKFIPCGLELLQKSTIPPTVKMVCTKKSQPPQLLYRCYGKTTGNRTFIVQIKKTEQGNLQLMSIFESKK